MFRSGGRTFRSGGRTFRSGGRTFRSGEHRFCQFKINNYSAFKQVLWQLTISLYIYLTESVCKVTVLECILLQEVDFRFLNWHALTANAVYLVRRTVTT